MKTLVVFHVPPPSPKVVPIIEESPLETENAAPETMPLDPDFLAWLEELL